LHAARDRRLLARLVTLSPGRHGAPPPVTTNRREELADGEAYASRKARPGPRNRRTGAPWGARLSSERLRKARLRPAALRSLTALGACANRGKKMLRTGETRARRRWRLI